METSYSKKDLVQMITEFNKQFGTKMKTKGTKQNLHKEFKKNLSCKLDKCVVKRSKKIKDVLKPLGPDEDEWLSNFDIMRVMEEYEKIYDNFEFLGAVPIDFNEIDKSFSNFNLRKFRKNGKEILGAIFNTDPSWKSGQHWIGLCMNIPKKTICFFDSEGGNPPTQVQSFIDKLKQQGVKEKINFDIFTNKKKHQKGNSACGIYCLHFIIKQLQGQSCKAINEKVINDKEMKKNMKIYFNS